MSTIIKDIYQFDGDASGAIAALDKQINKIIALERQVQQAKRGTAAYTAAQQALAQETASLTQRIGGHTRTIEGLKRKQENLLSTIQRLDKSSQAYRATLAELQRVNTTLAADMRQLNEASAQLQNRWTRLAASAGSFGVAGLGVGAASVALQQLNAIATQTNAQLSAIQDRFSDLEAAAQVDLAVGISSLSDTYELEFDAILKAVNAADKQISNTDATTALDQIRAALNAAANDFERAEILEQVNEYATFIEQSGLTLAEGLSVIDLGAELNVYSDKALDSVKEVNIRLGEGLKGTRDAVANAFGKAFSDDLFNRLKSGAITTKDAMVEISAAVRDGGLNIQQYNELVAGIGGGALEDAGRTFFESFASIIDGSRAAEAALTPFQERMARQEALTREVKRAQLELSQAFAASSADLAGFTLTLKAQTLTTLTQLLQVLQQSPDFIARNRTAVIALTAAISVLIARQRGVTAATIKDTIAKNANIARSRLQAVATLQAMTAQQRLNVAMRAAPYAIAVTALAALVSAAIKYNRTASRAEQQQAQLAAATEEVTRSYVDEKAQLDALFKPLFDHNATQEQKAAALKAINEQYGDTLGYQLTDLNNTKELKEAYDKLNTSILNNIVIEAKRNAARELINRSISLQQEKLALEQSMLDEDGNVRADLQRDAREKRLAFGANATTKLDVIDLKLKQKQREIDATTRELDALDEMFKEVGKRIQQSISTDLSFLAPDTPPSPSPDAPTGDNTVKSKQKEAKVLEASIQALRNELSEAEQQLNEQTDRNSEAAVAAQLSKIIALERQLEERIAAFEALKAQLSATDRPTIPNGEQTITSIPRAPSVAMPPLPVPDERPMTAPTLSFFREQLNRLKTELEQNVDVFNEAAVADKLEEIKAAETQLRQAEAALGNTTSEQLSQGLEVAVQATQATSEIIGQLLDQSSARLDQLADRQASALDRMLSNSEQYTAEQIELERTRLQAIEREQEQSARRARNLQVAQSVANSVIAVTKAAAEGGAFAPATIIATIGAIGAGIAAVQQLSSNAFYQGTDRLDLNGHATGRDTIPAITASGHFLRLDEGEGILQADMNARRHQAFRALRRKGRLGDVLEEIATRHPRLQSYAELVAPAAMPYLLPLRLADTAVGQRAAGAERQRLDIQRLDDIYRAITALPDRMPQGTQPPRTYQPRGRYGLR